MRRRWEVGELKSGKSWRVGELESWGPAPPLIHSPVTNIHSGLRGSAKSATSAIPSRNDIFTLEKGRGLTPSFAGSNPHKAGPGIKKAIHGKFILVDTDIIIYLTEEIRPYFPLSRELFSMLESGEVQAVISILTIAEIIQGPLKSGDNDIAKEVRNYLYNFPNLTCVDLTTEALQQIGRNDGIQWKALRTMDRLIVASGLQSGVELFISNDRHFKKALPAGKILAFDWQPMTKPLIRPISM